MENRHLAEQIAQNAEHSPDSIAIKYNGKDVSYRELEREAGKIAAFICNNGRSGRNTAVLLDRSPELIISLLGLLKCGSVFVPLDPALPVARVEICLLEAEVEWVITSNAHRETFKDAFAKAGCKVLIMDSLSKMESGAFPIQVRENKYSYIFFTSGSTGKPKGVLGRSRSLLHFIRWEIAQFGLDRSFNVSQFTSPSFDAILRDIFVPLAVGGTCCVPHREVLENPVDLVRWIETDEIALIHTVPSFFKVLMKGVNRENDFSSLKYILLSGELLRGNDIYAFLRDHGEHVQLVNFYGSTETTMIKLFYPVQANDGQRTVIPVGKPMADTQAMVLDRNLKKCRTGITGEIYIRTPYVTSGYYNDKESTRKVFIRNPFSDNPHDLIYRTGDLGRQLPDGNFEVVGRIDHQVKIRGTRVELGEIENRLLSHDSIQDAVVTARGDENGETRLCAYYTSGNEIPGPSVKEYLSGYLPAYMVPSFFVRLEQFPLTNIGKVDRDALPEPAADSTEKYVAPRNRMEQTLAAIWAGELGLDEKTVGIDADFFQLGGHSLKASAAVAKIHKAFNVRLPLAHMFKTPTIRGIGAKISQLEQEDYVPLAPVEPRDYYELSSAQKRLYILQQLDLNSTAYNIPIKVELDGDIDEDRIETIFNGLIARHEALRTSFHMKGGEVFQKVHHSVDFRIETESGGYRGFDDFIRPFDLTQPPLLRVRVQRTENSGFLLAADMHHTVSDGISANILMKDFMSLYRGEDLADLHIQYKDFSHWQNERQLSRDIKTQEAYWLETFTGDIPRLNLPLDFKRPEVKRFEGAKVNLGIDTRLSRSIKEFSHNCGVTLYMTLAAACTILLYRYSGQEDIVLGSPVSGRRHADVENLLGVFVNMIALRSRPGPHISVRDHLQNIKAIALEAFDNQDFPFEDLIRRLNLQGETGRNPLFDVGLVLQNTRSAIDIPPSDSLRITQHDFANRGARFDLLFIAIEIDDQLDIILEYSSQLFRHSGIETMGRHYREILRQMIDFPEIHLSRIDLLTDEEKNHFIYRFNKTETGDPAGVTLLQLLDEQAERTPQNTALISPEGHHITYRCLHREAGRLAQFLVSRGVGPGVIVGITAERSVEMLKGILGILKAGGAYLPISPVLPAARQRFMLVDSATKHVLVQQHLLPQINTCIEEGANLYVLDDPDLFNGIPVADPPMAPGPGDPGYVIYTSGSTGNPKGVVLEHRGIANYIRWAAKQYVGDDTVTFPFYTPFSFDLTVTSIFTPLATGNAVILYTGAEKEFLVKQVLAEDRVDIVKLTPSHLKLLKELPGKTGSRITRLIVGGENLESQLAGEIQRLFDGRTAIYNEYGPTETVVGSMIHQYRQETDTGHSVPIGTPIDNTKIFILDAFMEPVPVGVAGELYISGHGVARGYLNRPELTARRFIRLDSFYESERSYKTGDLARWLPGGNIEFLGRMDHQVKIRGFRIELGEIEEKIRQFDRDAAAGAPAVLEPVEDIVESKALEQAVHCNKCLLTDNFPGLHLDEEGVCSVCRQYESYKEYVDRYFRESGDFIRLVRETTENSGGNGGYDCLLMYSGGKDSSYVLYRLLDMGLKVLTFTFDNGYISKAAFENIRRTTRGLDVDHVTGTAEKMNHVFVESLRSNHNVCHGCWHAVNMYAARLAREQQIPMVISGLSRGQIFEMRLEGLFRAGIFDPAEIEEKLRLFRNAFFSSQHKFTRTLGMSLEAEEVESIRFVDFFRYYQVPVREIEAYLDERGWVRPVDTGFCSSNCIINDVGIYVYLKERGHHFYAAPLSWDVRLGMLSREAGLAETAFNMNTPRVGQILEEIGYHQQPTVTDAVVLDKQDRSGNAYLCAYIAAANGTVPFNRLREHLAAELPDHMIPSRFFQVDRIPLTSGGKADRRALLKMEGGQLSAQVSYVAPRDQKEIAMADICKEILGLEKIGVNDNLFHLGATSFEMIKLTGRLQEALSTDIQVVSLFEYPTIRSFLEFQETGGPGGGTQADARAAAEDRQWVTSRKKGKDTLNKLRRKRQSLQ